MGETREGVKNMAVMNSLSNIKAGAQPKSGEFTYLANGEEVRLSASMVKQYLVSGDAQAVTNQEVMMFLSLCRYQHLNPFLREAYLVKYGTSPATIVVGKDTFTKRANKNPNYRGKQAGIIVRDADGNIQQREGTFYAQGEEVVGGWAKIFVKDREPELNTVSFDEYAGRKKDGTLNSQWATKPATMIRKVAVVQALRECFPEDFGAMYSPEEMSNANPNVDVNEIISEDDKPIIVESEVVAEQPAADPDDVETALFGEGGAK